jgi:hypothetical protein
VARAEGRVVRLVAKDTILVGRHLVVLHRVGHVAQGPIDSVLSDRDGRFRFRFRPDSGALYLVSAGYSGIEYFSAPLPADPARPDTTIVIVVADTSSGAPVHTGARYLVVGRPGDDGTRSVLEIVSVGNDGERTRVAPDTLTPSWAMRLPAGVIGFQAGQSEVSSEAMGFRDDSVQVFAALPPGEKQIVFSYRLPANFRTVSIPVDERQGNLSFLLEEFEANVNGPGVARSDTQTIEGRHFQRWTASGDVGAIRIRFPSSGHLPWTLPVLVGSVAVALLLALRYLAARSVPSRGAPDLIDALAQLDARYDGREAEVGSEEWARYQMQRARLKEQAMGRLAARRRRD